MSTAQGTPVLEVDKLEKTFRLGFFGKRVYALRGVSFRVEQGDVFGLLGPNGAGKTTTLKTVLGLIRPTSGAVRLFGEPAGTPQARRKLGYMPENPYIYQYLKPMEFLDLCGRLLGMSTSDRKMRSTRILERVGLSHALDRPIGKFSKGMMQRAGLAQALLHDPELLILDEPMSGLDPIGRKEVRDILTEERKRGKTLIITSHILTDIELLCDHVAIVNDGKLTASGALNELLKPEVRRVEIELTGVSEALRAIVQPAAVEIKEIGANLRIVVQGEQEAQRVVREAVSHDAQIVSVTPHRETLEDLFVRNAMAAHREA
jgi:ABC-2 type transport system ATP-binding protein